MFLLWVSVVLLADRLLLHARRTAVSLDEDVDTDKELVAHGISNFAAGLLGTVYVFSIIRLRLDALTCQKPELLGLCQYGLVSHLTPFPYLECIENVGRLTKILSSGGRESHCRVHACHGHVLASDYRHLADRIHSYVLPRNPC